MSIYEIVDVKLDKSITLRNVLEKNSPPIVVKEKRGTHYLCQWDLLGARIVQTPQGVFLAGGLLLLDRDAAKEATKVKVYDFVDKELGKAIPYGVYDIAQNEGFVNVGISHDTAAFAVATIRAWWNEVGKERFGTATKIYITADGGGSNSSRSRLWKSELQTFSNETGLEITVSHYPPGTSKWNKIEHRLFSYISINWRAKPLTSLQVTLELIAATTTEKGLKVKSRLDKNHYPTKLKIADKEMKMINLIKNDFHGEWNYSIKPNNV